MLLNWILKKLIARERKRQIEVLGYTIEHDDEHTAYEPMALLHEAQKHYNFGKYIEAMALMQAHKESIVRWYTRLSEYSNKKVP